MASHDSEPAGSESESTTALNFQLDADTEAQLLALYADSPEQLERVKRRIARAKQNEAQMKQLLCRRQQLLQENCVLADTASPSAAPQSSKKLSSAVSSGGSPSCNTSGSGMNSSGRVSSSQLADDLPAADEVLLVKPISGSLHAGLSSDSSLTARALMATAVQGAPVRDDWARPCSMYQYGGPKNVTGIVSPVFPSGQLFRIVTAANEWAFYNDTRNCVMRVRYTLSACSRVTAASWAARPEGEDATVTATRKVTKLVDGRWEVSVDVPPEETAVLFAGIVGSYEAQCAAVHLSLDPEEGGSAPLGDVAERSLCVEAWEAWEGILQAATTHEGNGNERRIPSRIPCTEMTTSAAAVATAELALEICLEHKLPFVDPAFFPSHTRLFRRGIDAFFLPPLHWRPPSFYLPAAQRSEASLFVGIPTPSSVLGGSLLPDHNVLSVITAIAQLWPSLSTRPRALLSLFTHPETASALLQTQTDGPMRKSACAVAEMERMVGAYRVQLCLAGWWRSLLVDAHVPAAQYRPEFARCKDDLRALWLPLLEKAYAKAFGSYSSMLEATIPDVVAHLTGAFCCSLADVWPTGTSSKAGDGKGEAAKKEKKDAAFVKAVRQLLHPSRGGRLLLKTFPLMLAKSRGKRDRLEEIYRALGLVPGSTVLVHSIDELNSGLTILRMRQNATDAKGCEACLSFWRRLGKPWVDALWEQELLSGNNNNSGWQTAPLGASTDMMCMDLDDVPQYFQEGFCLYPASAEWTGGEVRAKGAFLAKDDTPSVCLKVAVTTPVTVMVCVTLSGRFTSHSSSTPHTQRFPGDPHDGAARQEAAPALIRGLALQVLHKSKAGYSLLTNSTSPDVFSTSDELRFTFHGDAGVGLELLPAHSPYYIIPRVSPVLEEGAGEQEVPYVLSLMAKNATIGVPIGEAAAADRLHVSFAQLAPAAKVFRQGKASSPSAPVLHPSAEVKEIAAEYQLCHNVNDQRLLVHNKRIDVA